VNRDTELWCDTYESKGDGVFVKIDYHRVMMLDNFTAGARDFLRRNESNSIVTVEFPTFGGITVREVYYLKSHRPPVEDDYGFSENWIISEISPKPRRVHLKDAPNFSGHNVPKRKAATMDQVRRIPQCELCVSWNINRQSQEGDK